jgi:hypothetical protein
LCFNDGAAKNNGLLSILGVRSGSDTVNILKQIDMERIWKAEIATLSISREQENAKGHKKERKEDQDGPDGPE